MKTKIVEKTLVFTLKMDFDMKNVDFSGGFPGPV